MKIFKDNPNLDLVYETSDGNYFYTKNSAENHAAILKEKSVKKHTKPSEKVDLGEKSEEIQGVKSEVQKAKIKESVTEPKKNQ